MTRTRHLAQEGDASAGEPVEAELVVIEAEREVGGHLARARVGVWSRGWGWELGFGVRVGVWGWDLGCGWRFGVWVGLGAWA